MIPPGILPRRSVPVSVSVPDSSRTSDVTIHHRGYTSYSVSESVMVNSEKSRPLTGLKPSHS